MFTAIPIYLLSLFAINENCCHWFVILNLNKTNVPIIYLYTVYSL